jgi:hypothetical protein
MQARRWWPFAVDRFDREWVLAAVGGGSEFCFARYGASVVAALV